MKPERPIPGGDLEYAVLAALWEMGSASAREVHDRVGRPDGLVYTTVAKVLDRLLAKGLVARRRSGRAFLFRPTLDRRVVERSRARAMLQRLLGEEPQPAMAALVEAFESIAPELLDELARVVAARRRSRRGP